MPASKQVKILSVRLPEADLRRFKSLAASRSMSVQTAVHQAMEAWALEDRSLSLEPISIPEGSLTDVDVFQMIRKEKAAEKQKERGRQIA